MIITTYFNNAGTPATSLSPTIDVYKVSDGTKVVNAQGMTEIGGGFYKYDFSTYDESEEYVFIADGTDTLSGYDRYVQGNNSQDTGVVLNQIRKATNNRWKITGNQMIVYDDDGTTPLYTYDLKDSNGDASSTEVYERTPA